jgi:hypothetical protein
VWKSCLKKALCVLVPIIGNSGLVSLPDIYCEDAVSLKPLSCFVDVNAPGYQPNPNFRIGASKAAVTCYCLFLVDVMSPNEEG